MFMEKSYMGGGNYDSRPKFAQNLFLLKVLLGHTSFHSLKGCL